jgi:hypothetical protein
MMLFGLAGGQTWTRKQYVRFEVFTAVTTKNAVFWNVTPCDSCKNRRSSETSVLIRATQRNIPEDDILRGGSMLPRNADIHMVS